MALSDFEMYSLGILLHVFSSKPVPPEPSEINNIGGQEVLKGNSKVISCENKDVTKNLPSKSGRFCCIYPIILCGR